jgi:hypothetical protein
MSSREKLFVATLLSERKNLELFEHKCKFVRQRDIDRKETASSYSSNLSKASSSSKSSKLKV